MNEIIELIKNIEYKEDIFTKTKYDYDSILDFCKENLYQYFYSSNCFKLRDVTKYLID